jgi:hypothetical protein
MCQMGLLLEYILFLIGGGGILVFAPDAQFR